MTPGYTSDQGADHIFVSSHTCPSIPINLFLFFSLQNCFQASRCIFTEVKFLKISSLPRTTISSFWDIKPVHPFSLSKNIFCLFEKHHRTFFEPIIWCMSRRKPSIMKKCVLHICVIISTNKKVTVPTFQIMPQFLWFQYFVYAIVFNRFD